MKNPLFDEDTPIGKVVTIATVGVLAFIGLIVSTCVQYNREGAKAGFRDDNIDVIALYENDSDTENLLLERCKKTMDASPLSSFKEKNGDRSVYRANDPDVTYVQKCYMNGSPIWSIIYKVFKKPDAVPKFRQWAADKGYQGQVVLKWTLPDRYETQPVELKKPGSSVRFVGLYQSEGRRYMWDNKGINDLSSGITSHTIDSAYYVRYSGWLESIGQ